MVFLKPSMIKVGFFLVAGSQDQVPRMTQKAESLQAEEVTPALSQRAGQAPGSHSWPRAGQPEDRGVRCRSLQEPPREEGSESGTGGVWADWFSPRRSQAVAAAHKKRASAFKWKRAFLS